MMGGGAISTVHITDNAITSIFPISEVGIKCLKSDLTKAEVTITDEYCKPEVGITCLKSKLKNQKRPIAYNTVWVRLQLGIRNNHSNTAVSPFAKYFDPVCLSICVVVSELKLAKTANFIL